MNTRRALLIIALGVGLGLTLALLWALGGSPQPAYADPGTLYVTITGTDVGNCSVPANACRTIQYAVDQAVEGDDIRVATGVYTGVQARAGVTQVVIITKTLTLSGGYTTTNWTTPYPITQPTTLDAEGQGRVIYITDDVTPTVEGLHITGGDGSAGGDGTGGGIAVREAAAIIRHNVISDNVGSRLLPGGDGGGIYIITSTNPALIYSNTIQANVSYSAVLTSPTVAGWGAGGGIYVGSASTAIITGNQILSNTGVRTDIPSLAAGGYGGGIGSVLANAVTIEDNWIQDNLGVASGLRGWGGGILSYETSVLDIADNTVIENTAIISGADGSGGGMALFETTTMTLTGNWVLTNTAGVTLTANPLDPSPWTPWAGGGGIRISCYSTANDILTMQDNHVIGNVAAWTMTTSGTSQGNVDGGGLNVQGITTTLIISNEVRGNTAVENLSLGGSPPGDTWGGRPSGGGMFLRDYYTMTLSHNKVLDNVTAKRQVVNGVDSNSEGGGIALVNVENANVSNNTVSNNTAVISGSITGTDENYYPQGGGIMVGCWDTPSCNLSFADNDVLTNTTAYTVVVSGTNTGGGAGGGGLSINEVANISFNGDTVSGNRALVLGSASGSSWVDAQGGGIRSWNSILSLSGCTVKDNQALGSGDRGEGGGLSVDNNDEISNPTVTLTGNRIEGNVAFGSGSSAGSGGGARIRGVVNATLTGNTIISNVAAVSVTVSGGGNWGGGGGGGLTIGSNDHYTPTVVISDNVIADNTAVITITVSNGGDSWAGGGGVNLNRVAAATIISNQVSGNVAARTMTTSGAGSQGHAEGGGLFIEGITTTLISNKVRGNTAVENLSLSGSGGWGGRPSGGGMYLNENYSVTLSHNEVYDNVTARQQVVNGVDSNSEGGGIALINAENTNVSNNLVSANAAVITGSITSSTGERYEATGGGILVGCWDNPNCDLSLAGNDILTNTAAYTLTVGGTNASGRTYGGGLSIVDVSNASIKGNTVGDNTALGFGSASGSNSVKARGGGMRVSDNDVLTMQDNHLIGNVAAWTITTSGTDSEGYAEGGGLYVTDITTTLIISNEVRGNTTIENLFVNGSGGWPVGGGMFLSENYTMTLSDNKILDNVTTKQQVVSGGDSSSEGGGIVLNNVENAHLNNNLVSNNTAVITASITITDMDYYAQGGGIRVSCRDEPNYNLSFADNDILTNTTAYTLTVGGSNARARINGGGLSMKRGTNVSINGDTVSDNTALVLGSASEATGVMARGGGIRIDGKGALDSLAMQDSYLIGNVAALTMTTSGANSKGYAEGGGLYAIDITSLTMQDNHLVNNVAAWTITTSGTDSEGRAEGGGLFMKGITTTLIISNEVRGNTAVENMSLSGNHDWGGHAAGGGMFLGKNYTMTLSNNEVLDNVAVVQQVLNGVSSNSQGGGITLDNVENVNINNNTVSGNTAVVTGSITGTDKNYYPQGGGIMAGCWDTPSCSLSFADNDVLANTTAYTVTVSGTNTGGGAEGGGLSINEVANVSFNGDTVSNNTALGSGSASGSNRIRGGGGGMYIAGYETLNDSVTVEQSDLIGNVAAWTINTSGTDSEGRGQGGGLYLSAITTTLIISNKVQGNTAAENMSLSGNHDWGGYAAGGGMYLSENYTMTLSDNEVLDNVAVVQQAVNGVDGNSEGGGIALSNVNNANVRNNTISGNTAIVTGSITSAAGMKNYHHNGGGIMAGCWDKPSCNLSVVGNDILTNTVACSITVGSNANGGGHGGGLELMSNNLAATLQDNTVRGNVAHRDAAPGTGGTGGGMDVNESTVSMNQNRFLDNWSSRTGWGASSVWVWQGNLTSVNDVFARSGGGVGAGGQNGFSDVTIINDTFYDNNWGGVMAPMSSTVYVTNTIVYSHNHGLETGGSATLIGNYNLLSNTVNYAGGVSPGANDITNTNPLFLDAPNDDFHISGYSPAVDTGTFAGAPSVDFEDDPRPQGPKVDRGADEFSGALEVTKQAEPDPVQAGAQLTYTIRLTNTGLMDLHATVTDTRPISVTPSGLLTWTPPALAPDDVWTDQFTVTVDISYTGTLTNVVEVTTEEGATGSYTHTVETGQPGTDIYLPIITKNYSP